MAATRGRATRARRAAAPMEDVASADGAADAGGPGVAPAAAPLEPIAVPVSAAPLEPPVPRTPVAQPVQVPARPPVGTVGVQIAQHAQSVGDLIVDEATGQPPVDLDGVFELVTPYGSARRCRLRLKLIFDRGPHRVKTEHLLVARGTVMTAVQADVLLGALRRQAEQLAVRE